MPTSCAPSAAAASQHCASFACCMHPYADLVTSLQVIWIDVGTLAWLSTDSDEFYVDMALESRDSRYDGNRPRIRVRASFIWPIYLDSERLKTLPLLLALGEYYPDSLQQPYWALLDSCGAARAHKECGQYLRTVTAGMLTGRVLLLR